MFNSEGLFTASGIFNASAYGVAPALHTYHTEDDIATVSAPDYFPNFFNTDPLDIRVKDILFLECSDFNLITVIDSLEPVSLIPFINFPTNIVTDNDQSISTNASGPWAAPESIMLDAYNLSKECILTFPAVSAACTVAATSIAFSTGLPAALFPAYAISKPILVLDNSLYVEGNINLSTGGVITIEKLNGAAFTTTGNAGFAGFSVSFKTI